MSTIASPRESALRRLPSGTLTSPNLLSLDISSSSTASAPHPPGQFPVSASASPPAAKRSNRAALREYYNLGAPPPQPPAPPRIDVPDSEVPISDLDAPGFDASAYFDHLVTRCSLEELLRENIRIETELRALDAEKKALVYDNYNKLIATTETIRRMRANLDPLEPLISTLDPALARIYSQASELREAARQSIAADSAQGEARETERRKRRTKRLAVEALATPQRLRNLVDVGRVNEAKRQWELPRRLLVSWQNKGLGGEDVQACIDDGDAVFRSARDTGPDEGMSKKDLVAD